jgi:DNA-binding NarL/FixJ family response regulator
MLINLDRVERADADPSGVDRVTVVVGEGDPEFAREVADVLQLDPRVEVLGVVASASETIARAEELLPDIVLVGDLPDRDLGSLTTSLDRLRSVAVILLVRPEELEALPEGVEAAGFLRRGATAEEVLRGFFEIAFLAARLRGGVVEDEE